MTDQVPESATTPPKLFKLVHADGSPPFVGYGYGGEFRWSIPKAGQPGEWVEVEGDLVACQRGLHLFDAGAADQWIARGQRHSSSPLQVYEAEVDGEVFLHTVKDVYGAYDAPKWVARRVRLVRLVGQLMDSNAEWTVDRSFYTRRHDRYAKHHNARVFAKTPAWITSVLDGSGDRGDGFWKLRALVKAEAKLERARMEVARLSGRADTPNAKARRRALSNRSKQLDAYSRALHTFDANSVEACAEALGVRLSRKRAERLKAARRARVQRAKARIVAGVSATRLGEMVREAA